jgi:glutamate dehydrogenase/leucine dehydrogenase
MDEIAGVTRHVAGRSPEAGGRGDPSPATARTVFEAIRSAVATQSGESGLSGVRVGVQGVGKVGTALVSLLCLAGAEVTVTDVDAARAETVARQAGAPSAPTKDFIFGDFDVLAPCAFGEVIGIEDVGALRCTIIAGAANNPLRAGRAIVADALQERGILYVPDFAANAGGIIHVGAEVLGLGDDAVAGLLRASVSGCRETLELARGTGRSPSAVALERAERRIAGAHDALTVSA